MLKDALEYLAKRFHDGNKATLLSIPGDGRKAYVDQAGTVTPYDVPPSPRSHTVDSVEDLIAAAGLWDNGAVVWINADKVVLVIDDADRRDTVTLPLVKSHQFQTLVRMSNTPQMDQQQLIRLLRIDLPGALSRAELLTTIRQIKFRQSSSGESNVQHGSESLGRSIEAQVTGANDIPEQVAVSCNVYQNPGEREFTATVMCDLEIVPTEQKFRFRPLPDELERVTEAAIAGIRERIAQDIESVFYGTP